MTIAPRSRSLGNLVAESIRSNLANLPDGAQIGVTNSGGLRSELYDTQGEFGENAVAGVPDGTITWGQAYAVLPFNNTMALVTLTGADFRAVLEQQWQRNDEGEIPSRPYLQLGLSDNVTYTYDETRPEGDRITSVTVDGQPLDPRRRVPDRHAVVPRHGLGRQLPRLRRRHRLRRHRVPRSRGLDRVPRRAAAGRAVLREARRAGAGRARARGRR
ncbi:MAG: 5'-nucleotidase [Microbacterium arborescens]